MIEVFPFMLRVSKHSKPFFSNLLAVQPGDGRAYD